MMANIKDESGFDAANRHFDQPRFQGTEAGFAHGLWQMGGTEWNRYAKWLQKNAPNANWADPALQAQWQVQNLQSNYPALWKKMQTNMPADQQAAAFVAEYEQPAPRNLVKRQKEYLRGVPGLSAYTGVDPETKR
jgi:hypothetical protein